MNSQGDTRDKICVLGGGASGLTVLKNLRQHAIACEGIEREDDVGGNWYYGRPFSAVYRSTHLISSKSMTEYTDFPMPAEYPDYPRHNQVWEYLRSYARHFHLYELIRFNTTVERIEPASEGQNGSSPAWDVTLGDGTTRRYRGVVIANGHHWDPKYPDYPGSFDGETLHSRDYKTPDVLRERRVLVVGAGNSGCDIAVESAQNAAVTFHSVRRGYHYMPKYLFGHPADQVGERFLRWRLPLPVRRAAAMLMVKLVQGLPQDYGLPRPDHRLFESHPIVNSQLLYYIGHGDIRIKPDIERLCGDRVRFVDGSEEAIDVIAYATGFRISFPFIDREHLNWRDGRPELYLNVFHPQYDNLFVAGLVQPDGGQFGLVDYQAQSIAAFIAALDARRSGAERFRQRKQTERVDLGHGIHYLRSARHAIEVEHYSYRRRLKQLIASLA